MVFPFNSYKKIKIYKIMDVLFYYIKNMPVRYYRKFLTNYYPRCVDCSKEAVRAFEAVYGDIVYDYDFSILCPECSKTRKEIRNKK